MSERLWYYLTPEHAQAGPVPESELHRLIGLGQVGPQTLVWTDYLTEWTPAGRIAELDPRNRPPQAQVPAAFAQQAPAAQAVQPGAATLAPSELIALHAEQFASRAGMLATKFDLLATDGAVNATDLGKVISAAAVIALEQAGALRLQPVTKKAFLRSKTVLVAEPSGAPVALPPNSLEGQLYGLLLARGPQEVQELFYILLAHDSTVPWLDLCQIPVRALRERNLAYTEEQKAFLGKSIKTRPTPEALALASQDVSWIKQLLSSYNPAQWQLLTGEIGRAISRRTESGGDDGPDSDSDVDSGPDSD